MAPPATPKEVLEHRLKIFIEEGQNYTRAARRLDNVKRSALQTSLKNGWDNGIIPRPEKIAPSFDRRELPEDTPPDPEQKPRIRIRYQQDTHEDCLVVAIGDAHDSPRLEDKSRLRWLGAFVADQKPDYVKQIGDFLSLDSLCSYEKNDTLRGKSKPSFMEDMVSFSEALDVFDEGLNGFEIDRSVSLGNHEARIDSFSDRTPELGSMMHFELDRVLASHKWAYSPYGCHDFIGGVAFVHVPMTVMGKPMGGILTSQNIARDANYDIVYGHSHKADVARRPKLGYNCYNTAINLGCSLPDGHIEDYAKIATTGWWYGAWTLRINNGKIQSYRQTSMAELAETYGP